MVSLGQCWITEYCAAKPHAIRLGCHGIDWDNLGHRITSLELTFFYQAPTTPNEDKGKRAILPKRFVWKDDIRLVFVILKGSLKSS